MGCGSAKISLSHRRGGAGGGKRRDGSSNASDDSDTETDEGAAGGGSSSRHQGRRHSAVKHGRHNKLGVHGGHKVRPASLVTSTSVDSQLLDKQLAGNQYNRPKITTSFSQHDFSTTTAISGTSRIRVTLSHDGSLLEVETETFETLKEEDSDLESACAVALGETYDSDDPDAIRAFRDDDLSVSNHSNSSHHNYHHHKKSRHKAAISGGPIGSAANPRTCNSSNARRQGALTPVFPSCSGTQVQQTAAASGSGMSSSCRVDDFRRLFGGASGSGGHQQHGGDSSSAESASLRTEMLGDGSVTSVRCMAATTSGGCPAHRVDSDEEEDYDDSTEVTAFIAVADIEVEPAHSRPPSQLPHFEQPPLKPRAVRSKSINSILSQAEENHLQEMELKPRKICKECGCVRGSHHSGGGGGQHRKEAKFYKGGEKGKEAPISADTIENKNSSGNAQQTECLIKRAARSIERTSSATESSDGGGSGDLSQKDGSRKSQSSSRGSGGGSTPYKTASQQKRISDKRKKDLPDGSVSASPLAIEKHTECCCYCHQKRKNKGGHKGSASTKILASDINVPLMNTADSHGDSDPAAVFCARPVRVQVSHDETRAHHHHSAPPAHHSNPLVDSSSKSKHNKKRQTSLHTCETPVQHLSPHSPEYYDDDSDYDPTTTPDSPKKLTAWQNSNNQNSPLVVNNNNDDNSGKYGHNNNYSATNSINSSIGTVVGDKGRLKREGCANMCEKSTSSHSSLQSNSARSTTANGGPRSGYNAFADSNDCSIVTVPVAPIVDPNAVFNFDDQEWAELALTNGNPSQHDLQQQSPVEDNCSTALTAHHYHHNHNHNSTKANNSNGFSSAASVIGNSSSHASSASTNSVLAAKPKSCPKESRKQSQQKNKDPSSSGFTVTKESRTKKASKLLLSSRSSSFAGNSSSGKSSTTSGGKSSMSDGLPPRIPSGLRSAASSGCVTDMTDDGDVTDSTNTTMTSSSSIGDVTSMSMAMVTGICDTLDPTAVCLQVHGDFFNDFCDFFDDEDVGLD